LTNLKAYQAQDVLSHIDQEKVWLVSRTLKDTNHDAGSDEHHDEHPDGSPSAAKSKIDAAKAWTAAVTTLSVLS
jgi:hypothetical protein